MKKVILIVMLGLVIGVITMATNKPFSPTKIPYNNGFYAGPYNPKLPIIDPTKK